MPLAEARAFLIRNDKAKAMANGSWPQIRRRWNEAHAAVEADRTAYLLLPKTVERPFDPKGGRPVKLYVVAGKGERGPVSFEVGQLGGNEDGGSKVENGKAVGV